MPRMFSSIDHMKAAKQGLIDLKWLKSYQVSFSGHNVVKLEINNEENLKFYKYVKITNTLLNNLWIKDKIEKEIKTISRQMKMKTQHTKTYGIQ